MDLGIIPAGFNIQDSFDLYLYLLITIFEENGVGMPGTFKFVSEIVQLQRLITRFKKAGKGKGLKQIIYCIELKAFYCMFRIGRREDHHRGIGKAAKKVYA